MPKRIVAAALLLSQCAVALAGEIEGQVTDEDGNALKGVRVCLSVTGAAPGECEKTRFSNKNGAYSFNGLNTGDYEVRVLTGASLNARKADPYPNLAWSPVRHEITLTSRSDRIGAADFTGSFSFSNFQAELQLTGSDFPELGGYDLINDYVFLKVYSVDASGAGQNLIYLGQVSDAGTLLVEVSVPLAETLLHYDIYSANAPQLVTGTISLAPGT